MKRRLFIQIALGIFFLVAFGWLCASSGIFNTQDRTPEEQATYVAARATERTLRAEMFSMCNGVNRAPVKDGEFEVRYSKITDGTTEIECPDFGYLLKPVLNHQHAMNMLIGACNTTAQGDGFELRVTEVEIDRVKVPCFYLNPLDLEDAETIGTTNGIYFSAMTHIAGNTYTYFAPHTWADMLYDEENMPLGLQFNGTTMEYVDESHASLNGKIVQTIMQPYVGIEELVEGDCQWPRVGDTYNWRSSSDNGFLELFSLEGQSIGAIPNNAQMEIVEIRTDDYVVYYDYIGQKAVLKKSEVACRP